ncbi:hypothetical protein Zmor_019549 [Zophobas morio]|uniref:Uncharacterized protein n=1 Tax=Zophobas morio TaxID=2755281 RepID=A0AA38I260_9CUCU|nr:hypothetical protein Zmor_019549 [Zophobas morio]
MAFVKVKECLTDPRQLVKLILLVVCVCITLYQLSECVNKIMHPPITSYYKFRRNDTIKYPAVTVCRRPKFKSHLFPQYGLRSVIGDLAAYDTFKFFRFDSYTLEEFMNETTYSLDETIPLYGYKGSGLGENINFTSSYYSDRGLCHTIIPKETADTFSVSTGYWLYLKHTTKEKTKDDNGQSTSGFEIHIHDQNNVKDDLSINTDYLYIESAEIVHLTLTVQTYNQISTTSDPCLDDPAYSKSKCEEKCLHNAAAKAAGCKVPWLRQLENEYPECINSSAINTVNNLFGEFKRKDILQKCNCVNACNNSIYYYQIESRKDADTILSPSSTISIYFASDLVTDLTEVISYDWNIFLSDVGGSLGFLLGLSVIGFVNVLEEIIKLVLKKEDKTEENFVENEKKLPDFNTEGGNMEGENLKSVMEFVANCDMYHYMQEKKMMEEQEIRENKYI